MEMQSRRGLLKNAAKAAAIATGSAMVAGKSEAKACGKTGKEGLFVRARCGQCNQRYAAILLRRFLR